MFMFDFSEMELSERRALTVPGDDDQQERYEAMMRRRQPQDAEEGGERDQDLEGNDQEQPLDFSYIEARHNEPPSRPAIKTIPQDIGKATGVSDSNRANRQSQPYQYGGERSRRQSVGKPDPKASRTRSPFSASTQQARGNRGSIESASNLLVLKPATGQDFGPPVDRLTQSLHSAHSDGILPEVNTQAGDTAQSTFFNTASSFNSSLYSSLRGRKTPSHRRRASSSSGKSGSGVLNTILKLDQEELPDDLGSSLIKMGIEGARRKKRPLQMWKTPFEVDPPRPLMRFPSERSFVSSALSDRSHISEMDPEERIWHGIQALLHDAFLDGSDAGSGVDSIQSPLQNIDGVSTADEILPEPLVQAVSMRSILSSNNLRRQNSAEPQEPQPSPASSEDLNEVEMAQLALNTFMDFLLPEGEQKPAIIEDKPPSPASLVGGDNTSQAMPSLISHDEHDGTLSTSIKQEGSGSNVDQIALAEEALNGFMDVLLAGLEHDLQRDIVDPPELEQDATIRDMRHRRTRSTLTLFEVFQWSLRVNIDAQERLYREAQLELEKSYSSSKRGKKKKQPSPPTAPTRSTTKPKKAQRMFEKTPSKRDRVVQTEILEDDESIPSLMSFVEEGKEEMEKIVIESHENQMKQGDAADARRDEEDQAKSSEGVPSWALIDGAPIFMMSNPSETGTQSSKRIDELRQSKRSIESAVRQPRMQTGVLPDSFRERSPVQIARPDPKESPTTSEYSLPDSFRASKQPAEETKDEAQQQWTNVFGLPVVMTTDVPSEEDDHTPGSPDSNPLPSSFHKNEGLNIRQSFSARSQRTFVSTKSASVSDNGVPSVVEGVVPTRPIVTVQEDEYEDMPELVDFDDDSTLGSRTTRSFSLRSIVSKPLYSIEELLEEDSGQQHQHDLDNNKKQPQTKHARDESDRFKSDKVRQDAAAIMLMNAARRPGLSQRSSSEGNLVVLDDGDARCDNVFCGAIRKVFGAPRTYSEVNTDRRKSASGARQSSRPPQSVRMSGFPRAPSGIPNTYSSTVGRTKRPAVVSSAGDIYSDDLSAYSINRINAQAAIQRSELARRDSDVHVGSVIEIDSSISGSYRGRFYRTAAAEDEVTLDTFLKTREDRRGSRLENRIGWFCNPRSIRVSLGRIISRRQQSNTAQKRQRSGRLSVGESYQSDKLHAMARLRRLNSRSMLLQSNENAYDRTHVLTQTRLDIDENGYVLAT